MLWRRKLLLYSVVLSVLLCFSLATSAKAASMWSQTYGGTEIDQAFSLVATSDGGYAIAGSTSSSGAGQDFWLVKTDAFGNMQWNKTYGGTGADVARSLVATPDGGYAIAGTYDYIMDIFFSNRGDFWLVKTDENGILPDKSIKLSLTKEKLIQQQEEPEEAFSAIEIVPSMERLVEDFLVSNLGHIEEGLELYQDENEIPGRQYSTDIGTIDLLCIDKDKKFVIIEIKKEKGSDKTIGQITRYMGWVKQRLANNQQVRGIVIVHEVDEKLEYSASVMSNVEIKYYKIDLKFVPKNELV